MIVNRRLLQDPYHTIPVKEKGSINHGSSLVFRALPHDPRKAAHWDPLYGINHKSYGPHFQKKTMDMGSSFIGEY